MPVPRTGMLAIALMFLATCATRPAPEQLTVAAAANLTNVFTGIGSAFEHKTGVKVIFSYGSTAELAQQIANGGPYDLFAAADTEHIDSLIASGKLSRDSRAVYALGQLALWIPSGEQNGIKGLTDLASQRVRFVAVAQPDLAPYGEATVEALKAARVWDAVQPKLVYANSISIAKQMAQSGNADAAFTAYSLVLHEPGVILTVDPALYRPIEQALAIVAGSPHTQEAKEFRDFILAGEGREILAKSGYLLPPNPR